MKNSNLKIPVGLEKEMEKCIETNSGKMYPSKSEFIREALRYYIRKLK